MYQLIDKHPSAGHATVELAGRTYPTLSVVEDDDGLRYLLTQHFWVTQDVWLWALNAGIIALINCDRELFVLMSVFIEERTENQRNRAFVLAENFWRPYRPGITYVEMARESPEGAVESEFELLPGEFVHLHTHSEFSQLDGLSTMEEIMAAVTADGQPAVAITDHGTCASHPVLQLAASKKGIRPVFGMEAYFVDDRKNKDPEQKNGHYMHLVLWAMDDEGLRNLWAMSTESYRDGMYYKPRLDWDTLERLNKGVMCSTACLGGPLAKPYLAGDEDLALANLGRLRGIFGDRLYIELGTNHLPEQIKVNEWLVSLAEAHQVPLIAVVDSHYASCKDKHTHQVWLSVQTNTDIADDGALFAGGHDYHLMTADEVRGALQYLPAAVVDEAMLNTVRVASRCTAKMESKGRNPIFSRASEEHPDREQHDVDRLVDLCVERWEERTRGKSYNQDDGLERLERELKLINAKFFAGYFLMMQDLVNFAKQNGVLVGPGRGSGGGSMVAYVIGITEIDPVENDLLFERFMTEGRVALPDFDIDFPSSKKQMMFDYVAGRWGSEHNALVGTHMRLKNKSVVIDVARAIKSRLPEDHYMDIREVSRIITEAEAGSAGLGMPWEDLWVEHAEVLDPFRERYPELFGLCDKLVGRLKTYGTHPAGVIIDPDDPITGALPLRRSADDDERMIAQFDLDALEALGYVKFDLLNLRTLDTLQMTIDLIKEQTGRWVDVYAWRDEYNDPQVWEEIRAGFLLGIFQVETSSGVRMVKRFQPNSVAEMADVITLVRPGPMRSGLTETYLQRRSGVEETEVLDPRLEPVLIKTYACLLYQEDIMNVCMVLAGYGSDEADEVRKILGKKKVELVKPAGEKFVSRAVANGTKQEVAELLWEQMAEFAKYSFGRAHAFAYSILGYWTAWFKWHYPVQFLTNTLSTVKPERIAEFVGEARRMGYSIQPPDINESKRGFTAGQMGVRYGLEAVKGVGVAATDAILQGQPYTSWEDFMERKGAKCNAGHINTLVHIGAFDSLVPNRRGLEAVLEATAVKGSNSCVWKQDQPVLIRGIDVGQPDRDLPCTYDWSAEPREPSRQEGKFKKRKPLPAKCSAACRQFQPAALPNPDDVEPYTDTDIRNIEMELLGVFLSSTPFERIPPEDRETCSTAMDVLAGSPGEYIVPALISRVRTTVDRYERQMAFVSLVTELGELDATVFNSTFRQHKETLKQGRLVYAVVRKNDRGHTLDDLADLDA